MLADVQAKLKTLKIIDERLDKLEITLEPPVIKEPQCNQIPGVISNTMHLILMNNT